MDQPWWSPDRHADKRPALIARARALAALRGAFEGAGFLEVDCGALVRSPGAETHLAAYRTDAGPYLHTSPEFAMKRLLAAGETRIHYVGKAYRAGERGPLHLPEFTLLEWYRADAAWTAIARDALAALETVADAVGAKYLMRNGRRCDPRADAEWLPVAEAFQKHAGVAVPLGVGADGRTDRELLAVEARRIGVRVAPDDDWSDLFSRILVERVEPQLGWGTPCVLFDYPIAEAALARRAGHDPRIAERFELYACGVELANGFGELTDAAEQRRRIEAAMAEKRRRYGAAWPVDEDFLAAVAAMPPASGAAMGFDRALMLALGAPDLESVTWVPVPN